MASHNETKVPYETKAPYGKKQSRIEFTSFVKEEICFACQYKADYPDMDCECEFIYRLNRIRFLFDDEKISKTTSFLVSVEEDVMVQGKAFSNSDDFPVKDATTFTISCSSDLSSDDETTFFEPILQFLVSFFGVKDEIDSFRSAIIMKKKLQKKIPIERKQYDLVIEKIRSKFFAAAMRRCDYGGEFKKKAIAELLVRKLIHVVLQMQIEPLFASPLDDKKPNPHMTKRTKAIPRS